MSEDTSFPGLFFNNQSVNTEISRTAMRYFSSNTSQLAMEVSFAVSLRSRTPFREVIPG